MPHCIIEYANQVDIAANVEHLVNGVFTGAVESQLFEPSQIKVRASGFDHYNVGGKNTRFIHVTAKILSGRTLKQRQHLSQSILSQLEVLALNDIALTVEVIEMERDSYAKLVR